MRHRTLSHEKKMLALILSGDAPGLQSHIKHGLPVCEIRKRCRRQYMRLFCVIACGREINFI